MADLNERRELATMIADLLPEIPRRAHELFAKINGYFWAPCPLCGYEFGGHEWRRIDGKTDSIPAPERGPRQSRAICPPCTRAGRGIELPPPPGFKRAGTFRVIGSEPDHA